MLLLPKIIVLVKHTRCLKHLGDTARSLGFSRAGERGRTGRQVVRSFLPMTTIIGGCIGMD
jgi:hypothetical protein